MSNLNLTDYELPSNAYLGFDAQSIKELIIQRLNAGEVYTDHEYEGSNFSAVIDVIAYVYHLLIFYLNKMGAEATFTQTQLYENMNRIIRLLDYKPIGYQTPCISFDVWCNPTNVGEGQFFENAKQYFIPRFAYINVNGVKYTLTKDILFSFNSNDKVDGDKRFITDFSDSNILFQGEIIEYVLTKSADGNAFETLTLTPANNSLSEQTTYVDFANFSIFVYDNKMNIWQEWTETTSLYLENNSALKFEKRLNECGYYEFRFGNNIHGKQLNAGDVVYVYYLKSDGPSGEIGINQLTSNKLNSYTTPIYDTIVNATKPALAEQCSIDQLKALSFNNNAPSTKFTQPENVEAIKTNASKVFKSNGQLITGDHIQSYVERNFGNLVSSAYVADNKTYLEDIIPYFYKLGLDSINKDSRIAFNQLQFSTSCNFNNIYIYMVPKFTPVNDDNVGLYVDSNIKQYIVSKMDDVKPFTSEIVPMDPIYMAVGFGVQNITDTIFNNEVSVQTPDDIIQNTKLVLTRFSNAYNKTSIIKAQVCDIIKDIFNNAKLGYEISTLNLNNRLLSIEGVKSVHTERNGVRVEGVSLMVWNPIYYNKDIRITTNSLIFDHFKYPFFYNINKLDQYIDVRIN